MVIMLKLKYFQYILDVLFFLNFFIEIVHSVSYPPYVLARYPSFLRISAWNGLIMLNLSFVQNRKRISITHFLLPSLSLSHFFFSSILLPVVLF